ncbi:hypothetical protein EZS27_034122 [termite gut metagenome]|uniref:ISXO2-like transposase domain-containing protein n=1 Tax=termite gut metagenome TaxID=433724 RepID=A0A5J4Q1P9_9ZZZZ
MSDFFPTLYSWKSSDENDIFFVCQGKNTTFSGLFRFLFVRTVMDTVTTIVKEQVDSQAELTTDDSTSYKKLGEHVKSNDAQIVKPEDLLKMLPWVYIVISNVKRMLLDTHHQLKKEYLQ